MYFDRVIKYPGIDMSGTIATQKNQAKGPMSFGPPPSKPLNAPSRRASRLITMATRKISPESTDDKTCLCPFKYQMANC